jgi:hypothetical protein
VARPEILPQPPWVKEGKGDFRDGFSQKDFLANFKLSDFEIPSGESCTFRTNPFIA